MGWAVTLSIHCAAPKQTLIRRSMARFCRRWADSYLTAKGNSDTLCNSLARSDSGQARPGQGLILAVCASGDASSCQTAELIMAEHKGQGKGAASENNDRTGDPDQAAPIHYSISALISQLVIGTIATCIIPVLFGWIMYLRGTLGINAAHTYIYCMPVSIVSIRCR